MPHTLLKIDASAKTKGSVTRELTADIVETLSADHTVTRDLLITPVPQIDEAWIGANFTPPEARSDDQKAQLALSDALVAELQAADTLVIGVPIYNFGIPSALKAWIDQVARVGVTFRYSETGPKGLLNNKRAILAVASGGTAVNSPIDYAVPYMVHVLGFLGITDVEVIAADQLGRDSATKRASAREQIAALAA